MLCRILNVFKSFILIVGGVFLSLSCLSYNTSDSSLNTAGTENIQNWGGDIGAITADLMWQSFGWMTPVVSLFLIVGGVFLLFPVGWVRLRIYLFLPAVLLGCWLLNTTPFPISTYTIAGTGGIIGFYLDRFLPISLWYVRALLWILCIGLILFSFKVPTIRLISSFISKMASLSLILGRFLPRIRLSDTKLTSEHLKKECKTEKVCQRSEKKETPILKKIVKAEKASFILPETTLLAPVKSSSNHNISKDMIMQISKDLESVMAQFRVEGKIVRANPGPVVTLYEVELASGIRTSRLISLSEEIAREMRAVSVRIAQIPGSNTVGIEMPNIRRDMVYIREMIEHVKYQANSGSLPLILGKDIAGTPIYADLAKMPHLLVAGTTGSGKSVAINTMILSLLYRFTPAECRLIMVDPKMLELSVYNNIPHLLTPVVTDAGKAVVALKWAVREMEDRYRSMSQLGVRNIDGYNQKLSQAQQDGRTLVRRVQTGFNPETGAPIIEEQNLDLTPLPYIVIIVDEMADLMMLAGKDVEAAIQRLAQMARAAGIHLILATQRPSVDVITGTIKSNFPTRMSFQVSSKIDSRTILGESGAEQLLGKGDMLYMQAGQKPNRIHGPFVSDEEIERVVKYVRSQGEPHYLEAVLTETETPSGSGFGVLKTGNTVNGSDDLYDQAVSIVLRDKKVSTSYVQRQLRIGYNKAADLIDRMEREGVISKPNIAGKREILVPTDNG